MDNIIEISSGGFHSLALKADGTVWAWGDNWYEQLGDGTDLNDKAVPGQVLDLTDISSISAGYNHSLALKNDGTVYAWGDNSYYQLGTGVCNYSLFPIQVPNLNEVEKTSAGIRYSLSLKKGIVWGWGWNFAGQLGNGLNDVTCLPNRVLISNVVKISAGGGHSIVLTHFSNDFLIPAGAHSVGAYNSLWKTDLSICNFSSLSQDIKISLLKEGQNNANSQNINFKLDANACTAFDDLFYKNFNYEGGGALLISSNTSKLKIESRTYNDNSFETFGQHIPAIHKNNLLSENETGYLTFLQKNENFRTNIGFSSLTESQIKINLKLYNSDGLKIAEKCIELEPFGYRQENDIFGQFGLNNISLGYATVSSTTDGAIYISYASIIDNKSNDPIFIPAKE